MATKTARLETLITPGEWKFDGQTPNVFVNQRVIASVGDLCIDSQWAEDSANARLIAAAPLLLEHLRDLVEAFPAGEKAMEVAAEIGCDAQFHAASVLLHQIDNDML